jgi:tetratricopeptide (TPR) repeat protein
MLAPRQEIAWREWWYPVHGLGDGFEFATKDVTVHTARTGGNLELRLLATGEFRGATCTLSQWGLAPVVRRVDLSPKEVCALAFSEVAQSPVQMTVKAADGRVLAEFTTPLPIPKVSPPDPSKFEEKPDDQLTVEEKYCKGRKYDRDTNRLQARKYYELALGDDPGHVASLRALAVLDLEAGLYEDAISRLSKALDRDSDDGLSWYLLGVCRLKRGDLDEALRCGYEATKYSQTVSRGHDLVGRASMRVGERSRARDAFRMALRTGAKDSRTATHYLLATYAQPDTGVVLRLAQVTVARDPTNLAARAIRALSDEDEMGDFVRQTRSFVGEYEFEMLETALVFAELGLTKEAVTLLDAACVKGVPQSERSPLPLYYLAYYASRHGDEVQAKRYLSQAEGIWRDYVFPSRPEALDVFKYAIEENPRDAHAHLHLGNLLGGLGRVDEAVRHWEEAAELNPKLSIAWRNLGLAAAARENDLKKATADYRKAIAARPGDQTLYRDLAEILIADAKRPEAIKILETMPYEGMRRADVTIMLAQAYLDEKRYDQTIELLESTPYFVNWEGQNVTWVQFNKAHVARGRIRLEEGNAKAALEDFQAALTYPKNLGVGRSNEPQEAAAQYGRGKALEALGRLDQARAAWKEGAAGAQGSDEQNRHRELCKEALKRLETT